MQILSKNKRQCFVVLLAATISLTQPVLASANNSINDLGERDSIIAGISSPNLKDDVLYRPRWSLPSNGSLQKLPVGDETSDDDSVEAPDKKSAPPQADAPVKAIPPKKPAISRSERLNLGQSAQTKAPAESDISSEPKAITPVKTRAFSADAEPTPLPPDTSTPAKRQAPAAIPQATPALQTPTRTPTRTPTQAPTQAPTMSAPIPGAFIINHAPSSILPSLSAETAEEAQPLATSPKEESNAGPPKVIEAGVSMWDAANVSKIVDSLVDSHFASSKTAQDLDKNVQHFKSPTQRAIASTKDSLNRSLGTSGNDPSARAAKIALEENIKARDKSSAEYQRQKYVDTVHSQVVASMAQIAMGLGTEDSVRRDQILKSGLKSLTTLVGDDQAQQTMSSLRTWLANVKLPAGTFEKPVWDTMEREVKLEAVIKAALAKDEVVAEIRKRLYKYAHPSKVSSVSSKVVATSLNTVAIISPGFAIPIGAEAALDAYIAATGGSEEAKLEKELIYDKRIQSRLKVLDQEATLALDNYRFALVTKNPSLLIFSEAVISDMTSEPVANQILIGQVAPGQSKAIAENLPGISESQQPKEKSGVFNTIKSSVLR
ncbi:MAG: hypothetical protein P4L53_16830 [Candidatus Obscuribacterales bacterium]|nr:hypothetical protein [Candidatus Obscuribacterales bacterium]